MKKILLIILGILFILILGFVFWANFFPSSFINFWNSYPVFRSNVSNTGLVNPQIEELLSATSSEPVLATNGKVIINNTTWNVEIVDNDIDKAIGLANRQVLVANQGMLFVFDTLAPQLFWMKDMLVPIDMIFLDDNWKIVLIESNVQPDTFPKTFGGGVKSKYVLEIKAFEANINELKVGDRAIYLNK